MGLALLPGALLAGSLVLLHRGKITHVTQRRGVVVAWEMGVDSHRSNDKGQWLGCSYWRFADS